MTLRATYLLSFALLASCSSDSSNSNSAGLTSTARSALREIPALRLASFRFADSLGALVTEENRPGLVDLFSSSNVHLTSARVVQVLELSARAAALVGEAQQLAEIIQIDTTSSIAARAAAAGARDLLAAGPSGTADSIIDRAERTARADTGLRASEALAVVAGALLDRGLGDRARQTARDITDPFLRTRTQTDIARRLIDSSDLTNAVTLLLEARESAEKISSRRLARGGAYGDIAEQLIRAGSQDEAMKTSDSYTPDYRSLAQGAARARRADLVLAMINKADDDDRLYAINDAMKVYRDGSDTASMVALVPEAEKDVAGGRVKGRGYQAAIVVDLLAELGFADRALALARTIDTAGSPQRSQSLAAAAGAFARSGNQQAATAALDEIRARIPNDNSGYLPFLTVARQLDKFGGRLLARPFADSALVLTRADTSAYSRFVDLESIAEYFMEARDTAKVEAILSEATPLLPRDHESFTERMASAACLAASAGLSAKAKQMVEMIPATDPWRDTYRLWIYSIIVIESAKAANPVIAQRFGADNCRLPGIL